MAPDRRLPAAAAIGLACAFALLASCGESGSRRTGCAEGHDASGLYRFVPSDLDAQLATLTDSLRSEGAQVDDEALAALAERMKREWASATLALESDGTFTLSGVDHELFRPIWRGTWEVVLEPFACVLFLRDGDLEVRALLQEDRTIVWKEDGPGSGIVLTVLLERARLPR